MPLRNIFLSIFCFSVAVQLHGKEIAEQLNRSSACSTAFPDKSETGLVFKTITFFKEISANGKIDEFGIVTETDTANNNNQALRVTRKDPVGKWELSEDIFISAYDLSLVNRNLAIKYAPLSTSDGHPSALRDPTIFAESGQSFRILFITKARLADGKIVPSLGHVRSLSPSHNDKTIYAPIILPDTNSFQLSDPSIVLRGGKLYLAVRGDSPEQGNQILIYRSTSGRFAGPWERVAPGED